ncbi:glycosyltransferase [Lentisphaera marina]|uniref:glycosyltransferase n=1 Tax=Lentisphaera marina TaxID=1111041 RepID=UPI002366BAD8|nr:glycosyltransferase [Lentisphaera marina]MDD7987081.1 glycosyltransferase [Lentisphaera marina]
MISVILPYFNAQGTLRNAIESILQQSSSKFELILCNDGSNDRSAEIANSYASDKRVKLIKQENQGVAKAHAFAMQYAQGDFIARMDSDDSSHHKRLELQNDHLLRNSDIGVSATQVSFISSIYKSSGFQHFVDWNNSLLSTSEIRDNRFIEMPLVNPSTMIRRELYETHGSYQDNEYPEDYDYWLKLMGAGVKIEKLNHKLLTWNDSATRLSRSSKLYDPENFYACKAFYLAQELQSLNVRGVVIWGAGSKSRKRAELLLKHGIQIHAYIDVSKKLIGTNINGIPVYDYQDNEMIKGFFILSYVGNRGVREKIQTYLQELDLIAYKNFILCA